MLRCHGSAPARGGHHRCAHSVAPTCAGGLVSAAYCHILHALHALRALHTSLRSYPLECSESAIAPDLLARAKEAGMDSDMFGDDVMAFMSGGVSPHLSVPPR